VAQNSRAKLFPDCYTRVHSDGDSRDFGFDVQRKCFDFIEKFADSDGGFTATLVQHGWRHYDTTQPTARTHTRTHTQMSFNVFILLNGWICLHCVLD